MHIDELLGRFAEVTPQRDGGYIARCPDHDDTNPSLRIWVGEDRKVRMTCRAGCETDGIRTAAGLNWGDLFDVTGDVDTVPAAPPSPADADAISSLARYVTETSWELKNDPEPSAARAYAADRFGLSEDAAFALGVGVDDGAVWPYFPHLSAAYSRHPRLTVPLRDFEGVARGLQGRDISGACPARWVSLTNPDGQSWQRWGYMAGGGGYDAVIVAEGPGDGLTAVALGYDAVVIRGAALAGAQGLSAQLAAGLVGKQVVAAGDNDSAGRAFNRRLAEGLAPYGIPVAELRIPDHGPRTDITRWREADPDSFAEGFHAAVRAAKPVTTESDDEMTVGSAAYWERQRKRLNPKPDIMHVNYAQFVADHCGDRLRHVQHIGWFRWDGRVWREAGDAGAAMQAITDAAGILLSEKSGEDWAVEAASKMLIHGVRVGVANEMAVLPEFAATVDDMDAHRHLLTFQNGTVDLRSGTLRPHSPADMLTQLAPVDYVPDAPAPRWLRFVEEIFPGDAPLQEYYQTFLGMCITGEVKDHALGVWYGAHGRNGKGTTVRTMAAAFGSEIVHDVPFEIFEARGSQQVHTETVAALRSARMVVAQEGNQGVPMDTARLKNWTGGDRIEARHLYGRTFKFAPKFTLVLATNHLPEFASGGEALWARTRAVHFGECFAERVDMDLEPTVQGPEREGVAAWIVAGAVRYYAAGRLVDPLSVLAAKEHHKDEVDPLKPLVGELFDYAPAARVKRSEFNAELKEWRDSNGERGAKFAPGSVKRHLLTNGVTEVRRKDGLERGWFYEGIYLMSDPPRDMSGDPEVFDTTSG